MIDFDSLVPTIENDPLKIIIYGTSGIGKSTFAAQSPNAIVVDLEGGMGKMPVTKYKAENYEAVTELLKSLEQRERKFDYLVIDSLDWLERLMSQHICAKYNARTLNDRNCKAFAYGAGERLLLALWDDFIKKLDIVHKRKNMGVILIAHSQITKFNDPMTESYDQYSIKLEKRCSERIKEWVEAILFANFKVDIEEEDLGFKKTVNRPKGKRRVLYTERTPSVEAKNRYNLPPEIDFPNSSWEVFMSHVIKGQQSVLSSACVSQEQVKEMRKLLQETDTDEDNFIEIMSGKGSRPIGEPKLENMPRASFPELRRLLLLKKENLNKPKEVD